MSKTSTTRVGECDRPTDEELLEKMLARSLEYLCALGVQPSTAQDLSQEMVLRALPRLKALRVHTRPEAWAVLTTKNLHRDECRAAKRRPLSWSAVEGKGE